MFNSIGEKIIVGVVSAVALGAVYAAWEAISQASTGFVVPRGAVVAFDLEAGCPVGWRADFSKGEGKFILGVGNGILRYQGPHQPDGIPNTIELTAVEWDDQGGAETHTLTVGEMPRHRHSTADLAIETDRKEHSHEHWGVILLKDENPQFPMFGGVPHLNPDVVGNFLERGYDIAGELSIEGSDEAHNNMPPHIALYYCKKE